MWKYVMADDDAYDPSEDTKVLRHLGGKADVVVWGTVYPMIVGPVIGFARENGRWRLTGEKDWPID